MGKRFSHRIVAFQTKIRSILAAFIHLLLRGRVKIGCSSLLFSLERWMREQKATLIENVPRGRVLGCTVSGWEATLFSPFHDTVYYFNSACVPNR